MRLPDANVATIRRMYRRKDGARNATEANKVTSGITHDQIYTAVQNVTAWYMYVSR